MKPLSYLPLFYPATPSFSLFSALSRVHHTGVNVPTSVRMARDRTSTLSHRISGIACSGTRRACRLSSVASYVETHDVLKILSVQGEKETECA